MYIGKLSTKVDDALVYLGLPLLTPRIWPRSLSLLKYHKVRHVYLTWSHLPHEGVGYAPVSVDEWTTKKPLTTAPGSSTRKGSEA